MIAGSLRRRQADLARTLSAKPRALWDGPAAVLGRIVRGVRGKGGSPTAVTAARPGCESQARIASGEWIRADLPNCS
jgi:hypothetical protein